MMRLIDADELKKLILEERDKIPFTVPAAPYELVKEKANTHGNAVRSGIRKALRCMEQTPTIEAEPVVRCKDCKYWEREWDPTGVNDGRHFCPMIDNNPGPDGFCYLGEKMDLEG